MGVKYNYKLLACLTRQSILTPGIARAAAAPGGCLTSSLSALVPPHRTLLIKTDPAQPKTWLVFFCPITYASKLLQNSLLESLENLNYAASLITITCNLQ